MKVYAFTRQLVYKYDDSGIEVSVFTSKDDVQKAFDEWKSEELEYLNGWTIETDEEDCFEAFLEGDWCCNHTCGYIKEFDL